MTLSFISKSENWLNDLSLGPAVFRIPRRVMCSGVININCTTLITVCNENIPIIADFHVLPWWSQCSSLQESLLWTEMSVGPSVVCCLPQIAAFYRLCRNKRPLSLRVWHWLNYRSMRVLSGFISPHSSSARGCQRRLRRRRCASRRRANNAADGFTRTTQTPGCVECWWR